MTTGQVLDQLAVSELKQWHFVHVVLVKRPFEQLPYSTGVLCCDESVWAVKLVFSHLSIQVKGSWSAAVRRAEARSLEKNLCWCLPSAPPWEPHVKTDTCSLIALSQDPDCVCVCLYDSRFLCVPLNLGLCDCVSAKPSGKPHTSGPYIPDKQCQRGLMANAAGNAQRHPENAL